MSFRFIIPISLTTLFLPLVCYAQAAYRTPEIEALLAPLGAATNSSTAYHRPDKSSKDYERMVDRLRAANSKTLQLLMEEVTNVGALEEGQIYIKGEDLAYRSYRLAQAFKIAGTNAAPLFPELRSEFLSGRSAWGAECGLLFIGSEAWPVFREGLTNSDKRVQVAAMDGISYAPSANALRAVPIVLGFATNETESVLFRQWAESFIGKSHIKPQIKVPLLITIGEKETNWFNRCVIIDYIGFYGTNNNTTRRFLERTGKDKNREVRALSRKALREVEGTQGKNL